jgi:hypothetical protein
VNSQAELRALLVSTRAPGSARTIAICSFSYDPEFNPLLGELFVGFPWLSTDRDRTEAFRSLDVQYQQPWRRAPGEDGYVLALWDSGGRQRTFFVPDHLSTGPVRLHYEGCFAAHEALGPGI